MQAEEAGFISYSRSFVTRMQDEGRYDAANKLNMYIRKFATFLGKNEVSFKDFDSLLIRNYNSRLENQKLGRNSVSLYIRNLKRVYRLAVAEGKTKENHPFEGVDVSYRVKKTKNRLTPKEVIQLRYMDVSSLHPSVIFARDLFLFSIFTKGMTGRDMFYLTKDDIKGGRLTYHPKPQARKKPLSGTITYSQQLTSIHVPALHTSSQSSPPKTWRNNGGNTMLQSMPSTAT